MDREEVIRAIKRQQSKESLEQDFLATIDERISRYEEIDFPKITPYVHFASASNECILLYRDGYFLACIALCQAVAEAIVRLMCKRNQFKASDDYEQNVRKLHNRGKKPDCTQLFEEIWVGRPGYHHLNPGIPTERSRLKEIAKSKITVLHKIESTVFEYAIKDGAILPKYPKYWDINKDGLMNAFLRLEP